MARFEPTERARVQRHPERGVYDTEVVNAILDEGFICHLGFISDGAPVVIPTAYGRSGQTLYVHGSPASHWSKTLASGVEVCVTVTLVDGLVLARSSKMSSINYRSVVIFGRATEITDLGEKRAALHTFGEHLLPGREADARSPTDDELRAVTVLALPLSEVSAKIRTGPPRDYPADLQRSTWGGVLPISMIFGEPVPDREGDVVPDYLRATIGKTRGQVIAQPRGAGAAPPVQTSSK